MTLRITGHGHPQIRASHAKTLEFTPAGSVTPRATCVIAVGATIDPHGSRRLAGPVRITLTAGPHTFTLNATAYSGCDPARGAVIRRSRQRLPGTFATESDAAASDLPPPLVAALKSPATRVEAVAEPSRRPDGRAEMILAWADPTQPASPQLAAEAGAAAVVVAEDDPAGRLLAEAGRQPGDARAVTAAVQEGKRILVLATDELPGATVTRWLAAPAVAVDVLGLPPPLAAAAASPSRGPLILASLHDLRQVMRRSSPGDRICVTVDSRRLASVLTLASEIRGEAAAVIVARYSPPVRVTGGKLPPLTSGLTACCLDGLPAPPAGAVEPNVASAVAELISSGASTRAVARALAELTGRPRQRAYQDVLAISGKPGAQP
jgi:hypothetical protein